MADQKHWHFLSFGHLEQRRGALADLRRCPHTQQHGYTCRLLPPPSSICTAWPHLQAITLRWEPHLRDAAGAAGDLIQINCLDGVDNDCLHAKDDGRTG